MKTFTVIQSFLLAVILVLMPVNSSAQKLLNEKNPPTMAYSTRKIVEGYKGPALKVRRAIDNVETDVFFDSNGCISLKSNVSFSAKMSLAEFAKSANLFVSVWYDQSGKNIDATQPNIINTRQGKITVDAAGNATVTVPLKNTMFIVDEVPSATTFVCKTSMQLGTPIVGKGVPVNTFVVAVAKVSTEAPITYKITLSNECTIQVGDQLNAVTGLTKNALLLSQSGDFIGEVAEISGISQFKLTDSQPIVDAQWGVSRQPRLVKKGVLESLPGGATALRFMNGALGGNSLTVNNFMNDGGKMNLQDVTNLSIVGTFCKTGNLQNAQALLNTTAPTGPTPGKLQLNLQPGNLQFLASKTTRSESLKENTLVSFMAESTDGNASIVVANSTKKAVQAAGFFEATPLKDEQVYLFGHPGNLFRNFEGFVGEFVVFTSTKQAIDNNSTQELLKNQNQFFVSGK